MISVLRASLVAARLLTAGLHSFRLQWRIPAETQPGARLYLAANWASRQPPTFDVAQFVARLVPWVASRGGRV